MIDQLSADLDDSDRKRPGLVGMGAGRRRTAPTEKGRRRACGSLLLGRQPPCASWELPISLELADELLLPPSPQPTRYVDAVEIVRNGNRVPARHFLKSKTPAEAGLRPRLVDRGLGGGCSRCTPRTPGAQGMMSTGVPRVSRGASQARSVSCIRTQPCDGSPGINAGSPKSPWTPTTPPAGQSVSVE
jgi:hypothetical protein